MNFSLWTETAPLPLLALMTLLPLVGALAVLKGPSAQWGRSGAYAIAVLGVGLGLALLHYFDPMHEGVQLAERLQLFGLSYTAGVDGSNILFIPLIPILTLLCLIYLRLTPYGSNPRFLAAVLAYSGIMVGAFAALNLLQFWLWCVLELIPLLWLTVRFGTGANRRQVALQLLRFFGSKLLMILVAFLLIGFSMRSSLGVVTFDWFTLQQNLASMRHEVLIFLLLFFGFAIRMPLFPFHAWLPVLAERGAVVTVPIFVVGLKLGLYGMVRFILPLVPEVAREWSVFGLTLGLISIFYGALLALMQINMRRLLAFAVVSHTGLLVIGLFSFSPFGLEGSILLAVAYGLATSGMLFSLGLIYQRTGTALIPRLGGLFDTNAAIGLLFLISALTTMVMPGTPGYDAAHLLLEGVIEEDGWFLAIAILTGNLLAAAFLLRAFQQIFIMTPRRARQPQSASQHSVREELIIAVVICTLLIVTGFYGTPELNFID